jgi:NADP-dependent 3-hydroxy acid dehydrogenase YdfG
MPTVDLSGRVAAVTGASSGIGEATALALAEAGCAVAVAARRADRIEPLAERIIAEGGRALAVTADITDEAQARGFVDRAHDELGGLDILVNNAGVMLLGPFESQSGDDWRRMVETNCLGLLYCTHAALAHMRPQESGDIVNVSSVAGRRASAFAATYNLTKFGVTAFSEALRQEALHANIRVSVVEPGWVETELLTHNPDYVQDTAAERKEKLGGQVLAPRDIADAIVYTVAQPPHVAVNEVVVRPTREG